jgi:acetyl esterase/lipase
MPRRNLLAAVATVLVSAACSSGQQTEPAPSASTRETGTPPTSGTPVATASPSASAAAFSETSDVVYMTVDGSDLLMDIYTPAGSGPWPVVVAFHGLDSNGKDDEDTVRIAEAAAAEGMVVFAPSWIVWDPGPFPFSIEIFEGWKRAANCAVAFSQAHAAEYGGDAGSTVVYGFSAGAGAALLAALEPGGGPIPGCGTDASAPPAAGVVLGDGEYFLHSENFDGAFDADLAGMQAEVAALTEAALWPADLPPRFFLWVAAEGTSPRVIGDPADASGWLARRDPGGSIRADLDRLGQLDDGVISFIDAGQLLELRLREAGIEVTLDEYPGGHTTGNKVPELVEYLKTAAEYRSAGG